MPAWESKIVGHDRVAPDQLLAHPMNWRTHPQSQREALRAAIEELGYIRSVTVNKRTGNLVDGHERVWQALTSEQPFIDVEYVDLSPEDELKALATMDPISELATVDKGKLDELLRDVQTGSEALAGLLSDMAKQNGLLGGTAEQDEVPEPPKDPVTKLGDLWLLGEHRLLCGDSTNAEDVGRVLDGRKPFLMVTDPPYGVEYDADWRDEFNTWGKAATSSNVTNDEIIDWTPAYKLAPARVTYVWHAGVFAAELVVNLRDAGYQIRTQVIWRKPTLIMGRGHYHWQHEPCWYAVRKGGSAKWCGDRKQSTMWDIQGMHAIGRKEEREEHPTQKPVECMARPIRNHGGKDDDVYDPFLGSGTTIVAAEQLGRRCYGLEISPAYCDVIVERWEKLTGGKAKRNG
jgi:DNA modification methylase